MQAISFGGGEVSPPPMAPPGSPLMNQYEVPDLYLTLYSICVENGLRPTFANGVVRQFRHFLPDDYRGLDSILTTGGTNVQARNSIVNAWKLETKEGLSPNGSNASSETGDSPEEISKRIERIRKEAGDTGTPLSEVQDLEREAARLKLEEARIALAERKKSLGMEGGGGDEEYITIMLDVGGFPTPRRIKQSEYPQWAPYVARPANQQANAANPEIADLKRRLEEAEKSAAQERERRLEDTLSKLQQEIAGLKAGSGTPPEVQQKISELERQIRDKDRQRLEDQLTQMNRKMEEYRQAMSGVGTPEWLVQEQARLRAQAEKLGMVPAGDKARLDEEQIELESLRKSTETKNEAQAQAYQIVAEKAKNTGKLKDALIESGLPKVGIDYAKKILNGPGGGPAQGQPMMPNPADIERELAIAQSQEAARQQAANQLPNEPPPAPPTNLPPRGTNQPSPLET